MNSIPFIPPNAPFSREQIQWLNGYLAGYFSNAWGAGSVGVAGQLGEEKAKIPLTILFGSQTGTAEGLAKKFAKQANGKGFEAKALDLSAVGVGDLISKRNILIVTSTYGDGEPPDNAMGFWSALKAEDAPRVDGLRYSVLALGDTNYSAFCQFGKDCDARLLALGGECVFPRTDCDVDYEGPSASWIEGVLSSFSAGITGDGEAKGTSEAVSIGEGVLEGFSKKKPFPARLLVNRLLNAEGSGKEVRHYEISLAGSGLSYEVGDALGVVPENCSEAVSEILATMGWDGEEAVTAGGEECSLRLALLKKQDISKPSAELLRILADNGSCSGKLSELLEPSKKDELKAFLWGREIIDLLEGLKGVFSPQAFVDLLKKLQPRLYSISSSPKAHPDEVHLTVAAVRYDGHGKKRKGVCSTFLADRVKGDSPVPVFVQVSHGFRLPEDKTKPVIMCGPGTGIAPFRAFLEEREATGATGKNWLFFGDQKKATDFLYQEQLEAWLESGHLARLDLAFSRDQAEKIYVQTRMLEQGAELWAWLQEGGYFYVCGDASRMAKDVEAALVKIAELHGGLSAEAAGEAIQALKKDKRYQRDVY